MDWREEYKRKVVSHEEAARQIRSGDFVGIGQATGSCSPAMFEAILDRWKELKNVTISDVVQLYPSRLYDIDFMKHLDGHINYNPTFGMPLARKIIETKLPDFYPMQSSDLGDRYGKWSDVFICMTTRPDRHGMINLGLSNFHSMQAIREGRASGKQRVTIAEVNDKMPTLFGDNWLHVSEFDYFIEGSTPIPVFGRTIPQAQDKMIGEYVFGLIQDGDTIQMGVGAITEAVVAGLEGKHDLGILTEMCPIGLPQLIEKGIVTNERKPIHKGVSVATFCMGDQDMYDYVAENSAFEIHPCGHTNNPAIVARHDNVVAMNMALFVDLSGQIASEGIGHRMISGSGGQLDFMIGSFYSKNGRGITMLYSSRRLKDGALVSSIVPELPLGTPVTVPRTYAQYVVTEYGVADLRYKSRRQRADALICIAHPDLRDELRRSLDRNFHYQKSSQNEC